MALEVICNLSVKIYSQTCFMGSMNIKCTNQNTVPYNYTKSMEVWLNKYDKKGYLIE